jgi:carbamoyltransferase
MANISLYGSHNAAYVVEENGEILMVLELERFLNYKNSGLAQYKCPKYQDIVFLSKFIPQYIMKKLNIKEFDVCYSLNASVIMDNITHELEKNIPAKEYKYPQHHESHAAGTFYQSPYKEALIFSFDGGGDDGKFNIYKAHRDTSFELLEKVVNPTFNNIHIGYDLGFPYMLFAHFLRDINFEDLGTGNLVYSGKLMGLASYGKVIEEWVPHFMDFYKVGSEGHNYQEHINVLGEKIEVKFDTHNRLSEQLAWDIAATNQRAFEECFLEVAKPYMEQYPELPICITGGCGLNIILNTRLKEEFKREIFVAPDPNDCGVALGALLHVIKPKEPIDSTYSGTELLDFDLIGNYIQNQPFQFTSHFLDIDSLVDDLIDGKIVGVARGKSEHGPRALGNRSIMCDPSIEKMKDILNDKVKHREWYRPFAPVVRLEDVSKYFEWEGESRWMSFCPRVKDEWKDKLSAITHVDGTARVQTVTREQNPWLYDLLTAFNEKRGIGVLLNTSFNVDGKPILSTIEDAFKIFRQSKMDNLVIENYYFKKNINNAFFNPNF